MTIIEFFTKRNPDPISACDSFTPFIQTLIVIVFVSMFVVPAILVGMKLFGLR